MIDPNTLAAPDASPPLDASTDTGPGAPLYRVDFLERYRLWKGLERLATARQAGGDGPPLDTIAREEGTRAEWLNRETALDLLASDLQRGEIQAKHLEHNARRLGLDPSAVQAELERRAAEERERERERQDRAAGSFAGTVLAFDPGDSTGWALLRLAGLEDIREGRAEREGEPLLLAAGAFLVEAPAGEGWSNASAEVESMRAQMLAALASLAVEAAPPVPRMPELARRGVRAGTRWETRRSNPGEACAALIRELRPAIIACEYIYVIFPKGTRVETSEGPIIKSGMSIAMTTGLYRAGAISGAIRAVALAAGIPFVHCSAAAWRRAIVGNYRAKDREVAAVIARVPRAPLQSGGASLKSSHPRDTVGVALFALEALRPAERAPGASGEDPTSAAPPSPAGGEPARRRPGRPRKAVDPSAPAPVKRPRGRPRKAPLDANAGELRPSPDPASSEPRQPALPLPAPMPASREAPCEGN